MKKINLILLLLASMVLISACHGTTYDSSTDDILPPTDDNSDDVVEGTDDDVVEVQEEPEDDQMEVSMVEFNMEAKQWEFIPSTITVNEGDHVVLKIKSIDVTHGLFIREFNVNERLVPGKTITVEFDADKKGTFPLICNVQCGAGHSSMRGSIIVQ